MEDRQAPPPDPVDTFVDYLRAGTAAGREDAIASVLAYVESDFHANMFLAWCSGKPETRADGYLWLDNRVLLGPTLPEGNIGDLWFDTCELVTMIRLERTWFSLRRGVTPRSRE